MKKSLLSTVLFFVSVAFIPAAFSADDGWCVFETNFTLQTQGLTNDNVWVKGRFINGTKGHWIKIASTGAGSSNVSLALSAMITGKGLKIHSPDHNSCADIPGWYAGIDKLEIF